MKLLIITQKVDTEDSVLGFFHAWLIEFSKHFEHLTVICLQEGTHDLSENVKVLSLGKEAHTSHFAYIMRLYAYIWKERENYDAVFVHMNQEYVLLGWKVWKLLGKKIILWRNHFHGNFLTNMAVFLSDIVCCTSTSSYTARFKKTVLMPAGIDEEMFKRDISVQRDDLGIISLGRISPVKKIDVLINALILLDKKGVDFKAAIYGDVSKRDAIYYEKLREQGADLLLKNKLKFYPGVPHKQVPQLLNTYGIFVNLTPAGSFDKTILEAMATESIVVFSNHSFDNGTFKQLLVTQDDPVSLAQKLGSILNEGISSEYGEMRKEERKYVLQNHTLSLLAEKITRLLRSTE